MPTFHTARQGAFGNQVDLENEVAQQKHIRLPDNVSDTYSTVAVADVLTSDSTEVNALSPFLRLPPELKFRIYELVLGGQTLHIITKSKDPSSRARQCHGLSHHLCDESESGPKDQRWRVSSGATWFSPATLYRNNWGAMYGMLESSLLRCCRQIYNEANIVRYYSNTFVFRVGGPQCLKLFYQQVSAKYRNAIRRLHLNIFILYGAKSPDPNEWSDAFRIVSNHMNGLQSLYIAIDLCPYVYSYPWLRYEPPNDSCILKCILQEAKSNLKVARIIVVDDPFNAWRYFLPKHWTFPWTTEQKREWSQYLRKTLLCDGYLDTSEVEEEPWSIGFMGLDSKDHNGS